MNMAVLTDIELEVDTLIDGKARHQSMLVVHMCTQRAHTVWGENMILIVHIISEII